MAEPITGQYECVHSSGVGLDYFTSRIDRIILYPTGRFLLSIQPQSRVVHAARSVLKGEQVQADVAETRREGTYTRQDTLLKMNFDDGGYEEARLSLNGDGLQVGPNSFNKVSNSTFLPPTHRVQQNMEDIAKGLKIASTIGGFAMKAAKTLQGTISTPQDTPGTQQTGVTPPPTQTPPSQANAQPSPVQPTPPRQTAIPSQAAAQPPAPGYTGQLYCDQCGARVRPGKRFCGNCGAQLN